MKRKNWLPWSFLSLGSLGTALLVFLKLKKTSKGQPAPVKIPRRWLLIPLVAVAFALLGILATRQFYIRHVLPSRPPLDWQISDEDVDPASWGKWFPHQYDSYLQGRSLEEGLPPRKIDDEPLLETLWAGLEAAPSIRHQRGHLYSLIDADEAAPFRNDHAGCLACKSAEAPKLISEWEGNFFSASYETVRKQANNPVSCSDCHHNEDMRLEITRNHFNEALTAIGQSPGDALRQEMRTLACAQCHSTYYFEPETEKVILPWDRGLSPAGLVDYFQLETDYRSWTHALTGAELVKLRHPDYEFFLGSNHQAAGVACTDCHMPFTLVGNRKVTDHSFQSPLQNVESACGVCHRQDAAYLTERVNRVQGDVEQLLSTVAQEMAEGIMLLARARENPAADRELIKQAQELHFQAFIWYEWVSTANSTGFHNPQEAFTSLAEALRLSKEMQLISLKAVSVTP